MRGAAPRGSGNRPPSSGPGGDEKIRSTSAEADEILALLHAGQLYIPEIAAWVRDRGDLAAFFAGIRAGRAGEPIPNQLDYDDPSVFKRAHARGRVLRNELT